MVFGAIDYSHAYYHGFLELFECELDFEKFVDISMLGFLHMVNDLFVVVSRDHYKKILDSLTEFDPILNTPYTKFVDNHVAGVKIVVSDWAALTDSNWALGPLIDITPEIVKTLH